MAADDRELDLAAALGAQREASTQILSLYIPNKDRDGRPIKTARWIREAQRILARLEKATPRRRLTTAGGKPQADISDEREPSSCTRTSSPNAL